MTSLLVIGQRNPVYSVMLLIASFAALAGIYILLDAPFTAVTQIIVYAGAIMVLFLFVVMLLNVPQEDAAEYDRSHPLIAPFARRFGALLGDRARRGARAGRLARDHAAAGRAGRAAPGTVSSVARDRHACSSPTTRSRSRRRRS